MEGVSKLVLQNNDIVYLPFFPKEVKYLVDCALSGNAGCRVAFKDEACTQEVIINLNMVVSIEAVEN